MKKFNLLSCLILFVTCLHAQVQFVTVGYNSMSDIISFKSDGTSTVMHHFNINDPTNCTATVLGPNNKLYGTTDFGGTFEKGTVYSIDKNGNNFKVIYNTRPGTSLPKPPVLGPDGKLYITISDSLFTIAPDGSSLTFINRVASSCRQIIISSDGWIYGTGLNENDADILFKIKTDGSSYSILHVFDVTTEGYASGSVPCLTPTGRLFMIISGSIGSYGRLVSLRTDGSDFQINKNFSVDGQEDYNGFPLTQGSVSNYNGKIIFTTTTGGVNSVGAILSYDTLTSTITKIFSFPFVVGSYTGYPTHPLVINGKLFGVSLRGLYCVEMDGSNFQQLNLSPVVGYTILNYDASTNQIFYNTKGGAFKNTQIIKRSLATNIDSTVHSFGNAPEGYKPAGIIRASNGALIGINQNGGAEGGGTIFKVNSDGSGFTIIKDFFGNNGQLPFGQLLAGSDSRLYGVCRKSGILGSSDSMLIYGINQDGSNYSVLHLFDTKNEGEIIPELTETSTGEIVGWLTSTSSFPPAPKIFKLNKNGSNYTVLKTFSSTGQEGYWPKHGLISYGGNLYGVTSYGGDSESSGLIFRMSETGTGFSIIKSFKTIGSDGFDPEGGLVLASDNQLYGLTVRGGAIGNGTIYTLNPADLSFHVIHDFSFSEGFVSYTKPVESSKGKLYFSRDAGIVSIDKDGLNISLLPVYTNYEMCYLTEVPTPVTTELCPPVASTTFQSDVTGSAYQWQVNTGSGFSNITNNTNYSGVTSNQLSLNNIPSSFNGFQYRCMADGGTSTTFVLKFLNTWTGTVNNSWENTANWTCGALPDSNTDVVINSGTVVINSNVTVRSLKVNPGVIVTVNTGFKLTLTH